MDNESNLFSDDLRLSYGGQHVRAATRSGLVALDPQGQVVPALADRWNVTDGGRIFVFRLREGTWPDGEEFTAESVRQALGRAIRELRGTSLGLDLAPIDEVRAMAGRVVEIRLSSAVPDLLLLLAQPEMGLSRGEGDTGPMVMTREGASAMLSLKPPPERGLPEDENWREHVRDVNVRALSAEDAIGQFDDGLVQVVLGGQLASLPLAETGPLSRGTVRLDPVIGLFGLQIRHQRGVLDTPETREAIAMAIDRPALASLFNIGGWVQTTRVVAPDLPNDPGLVPTRWADTPIEQLREIAASRIANWRAERDPDKATEDLTLALEIGEGPGLDMLFTELERQFATIGIVLVRAENLRNADLVMVDTVARYAAPPWFLNQFNCSLDRGLCSEEADALVRQAMDDTDPNRRALLLAEAEGRLTAANVYIPIGSPLRWSLVRGNVDGFSSNSWAFHPLPDMAVVSR